MSVPPTAGPIILAPRLIALDWLTVNMAAPGYGDEAVPVPWTEVEPCTWTAQDIGQEQAYTVVPQDMTTAQFSGISYVMDANREKVATVTHTPHQTARGREWIQVQFSNRVLYTGEWLDLFRMFRAIGCNYRGISRIDVAADALRYDGGGFTDVIARTHQDAKYYGHSEWLQRSKRGKVTGAEFGSRASNKFIRCYNKSEEMRAKGVKPHIVKAWRDAFGVDVYAAKKPVQRLEIAVKGKEVRRYFTQESSPEYLETLAEVGPRVDLFASMVPTMFDFRTVADRARDAVPVAYWDWSAVHAGDPDRHHRATRNEGISEHGQKIALRSLFILGTTMGDRLPLEYAEQYAKAGGEELLAWYRRRCEQWTREINAYERSTDARTRTMLDNLRNGTAPDALPLD